ncbi:MAG: hypothetical protein WCP87_01940 [Atribacterota bacterium]
MKKTYLILFVLLLVAIPVIISGCGLTIDVPITPTSHSGYIRICSGSSSVFGRVYVDGVSYGYIDGEGIMGSPCTSSSVGPLTLNISHHIEIYDYSYGSYSSNYFTPSYSGQTFTAYY